MPQHALPSDPEWLKRAFSDLGLKETPGKKSNPRIVQMYARAKNAGVKDDSVAWCSAAVNAWIVEAGLDGTRSLMARSWLEWGHKLDTKKKIQRGAVLIFQRGNSSWQGHVCLLLDDNGTILTVIGGNQSDAVTIAHYRRSSLIGARWPNKLAAVPVPPEKPAAPVPPEKPAPLDPLPPPPDIEPIDPPPTAEEKPGWFRRKWKGITGGSGLAGLLGLATDPRVWGVIIAGVVVVGLIAFAIALFLFGRDRVAAWVRKVFA